MTLTVGSTFSGIGGLDLGFERAGARVAWTSEVDSSANAVLRHRFPDAEQLGSIVALVDGMFPPPAVDVLIGGPPCQDLSTANASGRAGLDGARSGLFHAYATLLDRLAPRYAVMEQVPGLLTANDGRDLEAVVARFAAAGYRMDWRRRDTRTYGPPQRRERLTFVAVRHDLEVDPTALLDAADPTGPTLALADVVDVTRHGTPDTVLEDRHAGGILARLDRPGGAAPLELIEALEHVAAGAIVPARLAGVYRKSTRARSAEVGETWVPGAHANTLTLNDVGPARATVLAVTTAGTVRTLEVDEAEALHGFPHDWTVAAGSYRDRMARLGNAVSVPVAAALASAIVAADLEVRAAGV